MAQGCNKSDQKSPTQRLGHFFSQVSLRIQNPVHSLYQFIADINRVDIGEEHFDENKQLKNQNDEKKKKNIERKQQQQLLNDHKVINNSKQKLAQSIGNGQLFPNSTEIGGAKQQSALQQMTKKIEQIKIEERTQLEPQLNAQPQSQQVQLMGQQLQRLNKVKHSQRIEQITIQQKTIEYQSQQLQSNAKTNNSIQQAHQFCTTLRKSYFNQKVFTQASIQHLIQQITQTHKNNSYRCLQQSFQRIKEKYFVGLNVSKSIRKNSSSRNMDSSLGGQFNLELTMKSRQSRQSGVNGPYGAYLERQDSLIYSNATSFGLQSTQNRSKQASRNNSLTKVLKLKEQNEFDQIYQMDKASSKGEVQNSQKQQFSAKSLSDTQRLIKYPPKIFSSKRSNQNSSQSKKSYSQKELPQDNNYINNNGSNKLLIKQQQEYQIVPLTQQNQNPSTGKNLKNKNFGIQTPQKSIKKSFSIKTYTNNKLDNSRASNKKSQQNSSVFSAQISQLQSRISRIKQSKLLKKLKLQEQLRKVNQEIQQIKVQEQHQTNPHQYHIKQKSSRISSKQKNTLQSRIKINDDIQQKKKAVNLIKNLRAQKLSRQNQKRNNNKILNVDIHQQMEDMMRLKYFNQQRVKQKRQLEIIQRMKQQEIRKIVEQKQKQESIVFLNKLKQDVSNQRVQSKIQRNDSNNKNKSFESPVKKTQPRQIKEPLSHPALQKKKAYLNKMRNFTIVKRQKDNIYQQALN